MNSPEKTANLNLPWHIRDESFPFGKDIILDCGDPAIPHTLGGVAVILNAARIMSFTRGQHEQHAEAVARARYSLGCVNSHAANVARIVELEAALRPFSRLMDDINAWTPIAGTGDEGETFLPCSIRLGDIKQARAALFSTTELKGQTNEK